MAAIRVAISWAFLLAVCFIWLPASSGKQQCGGSITDIPMSCCPTQYLPYCCLPVVKPCNETLALLMKDLLANISRIDSNPSTIPSRTRRGASGGNAMASNVTRDGYQPSPWQTFTAGGFPNSKDFSSLIDVIRNDTSKRKPYCVHPMNSSACLPGFFYDGYAKTVRTCPPGFYCPTEQLCIIPCPEGAHCTTNDLENATDKSSYQCQQTGFCCTPSGYVPVYDPKGRKYICAGASLPRPCKAGYYCPNVTIRNICPKGHFCREGSIESERCPILAQCKEGASAPVITYAGIAMIVVIFLVLLIIVVCFNYRRSIKFYVQLYTSRYLTRDEEACHAFQVDSGLRLAVLGVSDTRGDNIIAKEYTLEIAFHDLSLKLKHGTKRSVLHGVTGKINSGEVTAVMGPSGAGKTTFLNTLSGKAYYGVRGGQILINGKETDDLDVYRTITGFVPQEDVMHRNLTVKEVLMYQADLRLPSSVKQNEKEDIIHKIIELLELERVQDSQIGDEETRGISGGQRKRVNIGMELVVDPTLLFLDEPTSGLDSTSSLSVLKALRAVAEKGRLTVVCVIHQPRFEIFRMFHKVLFLGSGGRTVFQGTVEEADNYFRSLGFEKPVNVNPADFYMDVIGGLYVTDDCDCQLFDEWDSYQNMRDGSNVRNGDPNDKTDGPLQTSGKGSEQRMSKHEKTSVELLGFRQRSDCAVNTIQPDLQEDYKQRKMENVLSQFWVFLKREIRLMFRIVRTLLIDQLLVLLAGGVLGALNSEASLGSFFSLQTLSGLAIGLVSMLPALRCFGDHRITFWREAASGVNRFSYFLAVNVAQLPIIAVSPLIYLSLLYSLSIPRGFFIYHYLCTLGAWFACTGTGYLVSIMFNPRNSQMASVVYILINSLFSGSSPSLCSLDKFTYIGPIFYNLSYARWYLESLFEKEAIRFPRVLAPYVYSAANRNGYSLRDYDFSLGMLFVLGVGFRLFAFVFLCLLNRGKQK